MGDDLQTAATTIAAISIPVIVAGMVGACSVSPHCTFQNMVPRDRRRLNATVDLIPLSGTTNLMPLVTLSVLTALACGTGVPVRQVNHGWEGTQARRSQIHHHPHAAHSVVSLRDPPPTYPAHHLDIQFDSIVHSYGNISHAGGAVDVVPVPLPPSYDSADAESL